MYSYRKMSPEEKVEALKYRHLMGFPLHEPPHIEHDNPMYLITAATYEHRKILTPEARRVWLGRKLFEHLTSMRDCRVYAWVILLNHYHLLLRASLSALRIALGKVHNAASSSWNREDDAVGRRVWYRFADRAIRNERHFWATVNYLHANPVRHGLVAACDAWRCSSVHLYLEEHGEAVMLELMRAYPTLDYGKGWDI
ncbi:MAG TPA: transposase [Armatimonadota bacterium]|nr:transposase [Armatimonadota bacterium]HOS42880.1 transposase [Armatimonadota bacterium]